MTTTTRTRTQATTRQQRPRPAAPAAEGEEPAEIAPLAPAGAPPSTASAPPTPGAPPPPLPISAHDRDLAAAAPYLADWEVFQRELPADEPAWIAALRRSAIERFAVLGFPTVRQEEWRFTNLTPLARAAFRRLPAAARSEGGRAPPRPPLPITPAHVAPWTFPAP